MDALSPAQRATLADLADVLIPGGEGMPSARDVDVHGALVDRVLAVRPHASAELPAILDRLGGVTGVTGVTAIDLLKALRADDPGAFGTLSSVVVGAYFLDETVRAAIGWPGQGPREVTFDDETGYLAEGLLDPVLERG